MIFNQIIIIIISASLSNMIHEYFDEIINPLIIILVIPTM